MGIHKIREIIANRNEIEEQLLNILCVFLINIIINFGESTY